MTSVPAVNDEFQFSFTVENEQDLIAQSSGKFGTQRVRSDDSKSVG